MSLNRQQSDRLRRLLDSLTEEDIATLLYVVKKEQSWTFVRSTVRSAALLLTGALTALYMFRDSVRAFLQSLMPPPPFP